MGRLIDADLLLERIVETNNVYVQGRMAYIIDNMPTAFNVEAVCEQFVLKGRPLNPDEHYITISDAIEIVKGGVK